MKGYEINFDGLVGPTHNYSGLSFGNVASINSLSQTSNPKEAALQGLSKMKKLSDLSFIQAVLPPPLRPNLSILKNLGFSGSNAQILSKAASECPEILASCFSAASMWTANAATISPSADTLDKKVHITPANLSAKFHRSIEPEFTTYLLERIFSDKNYFTIHPPLFAGDFFADEGAANHNRFCNDYNEPGLELFVWGRKSFHKQLNTPKIYPARQTFEASSAIARRHLLQEGNLLFVQQNNEAIDAGVFHNDVISVANKHVFLFHEKAFIHTDLVIQEIKEKFPALFPIKVAEKDISLKEAVSTYFFNSQLLSRSDSSMLLVAPSDCQSHEKTNTFIEKMIADKTNPIKEVLYFNLQQSMANGGGPACLRLRVVVNENEKKAIHPSIFLNDTLYDKLKTWIEKHYRDRLHPNDFSDVQLVKETEDAAIELEKILQMPGLYFK